MLRSRAQAALGLGQLGHKLEQNPSRPAFLITEPGVGYRLRVRS